MRNNARRMYKELLHALAREQSVPRRPENQAIARGTSTEKAKSMTNAQFLLQIDRYVQVLYYYPRGTPQLRERREVHARLVGSRAQF